jgi:hypothetical protein
MAKFRKLVSAAAALAAGTALFGAPGAAHAESPSVLGGGSGIVVGGQNICSLTTIGRDSGGRLVGFTAAHCGEVNSTVVAESNRDAGAVGTVAYADSGLDYAVIVFDPGMVVPVNQVGRTCGPAYGNVFTAGNATWTQTCVVEGDSGGPVVVGTTLVGMVNGYLVVPCLGPQLGTDFSAVVADANARGEAGAGFQPI